eukprot:6176914-Pleurochrysis_carterae.AAC.2
MMRLHRLLSARRLAAICDVCSMSSRSSSCDGTTARYKVRADAAAGAPPPISDAHIDTRRA